MKEVDKIEILKKCITECENEEYIDIIQSIGLTKEDFEGKINFLENKYSRTCIANTEEYELILLAWNEGQKTPIHNHNGNESFVYVVEGKLEEVNYKFDSVTQEMQQLETETLLKNELSYTEEDDDYFHSIENVHGGKSLSLHLYKKPILECLVYDEAKEEVSMKELTYDFY